MPPTPAELGALAELVERSETLFAARVRADGTIASASPSFSTWAGGDVTGANVVDFLTAPQRPAMLRALDAAGEDWSVLTLGFADGSPRPAEDRRVFTRRDGGDTVLLVAEPALAERDRLVEQVLELNEDLIGAQRKLARRQRELERAQSEAAAAMERVRRLESIMLAGLTRPHLEGVLESLLEIARDVFRSDRAAVLLRSDDERQLRVAAAAGLDSEDIIGLRVPYGRGFAGSIAASARGRVVDDIAGAEIWNAYLRDRGGSLAGVPLVLEDEVIGVLHVSSLERDRFSPEDLALLERVGERASLAIGHAQLRERERVVAETLQHSLLPEHLPLVPGVQLTARYLSRARGVHVGGDFYDAVVVQGDRLALSIGDVAGKGLEAASTMGRLRNALRAYAIEAEDAADVLRRLDRLVVDEDAMATAMHLVLEPGTGRIAHSNAGHPPPLRVTADGTPVWIEGALAPPLGTGWSTRPCVWELLAPGDRVLLFTDGLVERRGTTLDDGLAVLAEAAVTAPAGDLDAWCDHVLGVLSGAAGGFEDDVALLAVELTSG
jgi:phosphoserine phosphatase RsbU/P